MTALTALKKRIRSRSRHWYMLDLSVKGSGHNLTLCLRHPKTRETATETVTIDLNDLGEVYGDDEALTEYADRIIERFAFPVRPLQLIENG